VTLCFHHCCLFCCAGVQEKASLLHLETHNFVWQRRNHKTSTFGYLQFCLQRRKCKTSTFGYLQFCLPEKKMLEDFHIWKLAISALGHFLWLRRKWESGKVHHQSAKMGDCLQFCNPFLNKSKSCGKYTICR